MCAFSLYDKAIKYPALLTFYVEIKCLLRVRFLLVHYLYLTLSAQRSALSRI